MSKVLVTGGAGFIGSNLVDALVERGDEVTVWDNLDTGHYENVNKEAKFEEIDITKSDDLYSCGEYETIYHLAALARIQPSFEKPVITSEANVNGTQHILETAKRAGARVVYAGSSSFYHDPLVNPYSFTKWIGEEYCKMYNKVYNVPVGIARFFNVYGPRQLGEGAYATVMGIFERQRRAGEPLTVTGTGEKRRDFTHVKDIVAGLIAIGQSDWNGEIFNLGTGTNYSINEVAKMFKSEEISYLPNRPGEAETTLADIAFSQEKLGYTPQVKIEEYIQEFLQNLNVE